MARNLVAEAYIAKQRAAFDQVADEYSRRLAYTAMFFTPSNVEALLSTEARLLKQLKATEERLVSLVNLDTKRLRQAMPVRNSDFNIEYKVMPLIPEPGSDKKTSGKVRKST